MLSWREQYLIGLQHSLISFFLPLEHKIHIYIAIRYFKTLPNFGENIPVISLPE